MATPTPEPTPAPKVKRPRLSIDHDLLKKLVSILEKEKLTKEQLSVQLGLENGKKISDSLILAAVKFAGNSDFLSNIVEKTGGRRARKGPFYSEKKGLIVPAWMFEGKGIVEGQKYNMKYGRKGIITLNPTVADDVNE